MKPKRSFSIPTAFLATLFFIELDTACCQIIWDRTQIDRVRKELQEIKPETRLGKSLANLQSLADAALKRTPHAVTQKTTAPPSGDLHDYQSFSRYWWPDPSKPDGLPYIRKDGVSNRKLIAKGDRNRLGDFCDDVQTLALAGYVFDDPRYTKYAATMVRAWFLDEATRMNPNLNFGQGVPGRESGRKSGIIDARGFMLVLDSVALFNENAWSVDDQTRLKKWFDEYQTWLAESPLGKGEQKSTNNHGSWYAAQRAHYALFAGKKNVAREIVKTARNRIAEQFDGDGNQADELKRTRSLFYSVFNLSALAQLACVGDQVGEDLWDFEPEHGCGIKKAFSGLLPCMTGEKKWQHPQLEPFSLSKSSHMTLRLFSRQFDDDSFRNVAEKLGVKDQESDFSLIVVGD